MNFAQIKEKTAPYKDILLFAIALFGANFFWKYTITGDENSTGPILWFGLDISAPFLWLASHIAQVVYELVSLTRDSIWLYLPDVLRYNNGNAIRIVWGCTALKQSFIWICIMAVARGSWKHKLWFVPLGLVCIYMFNILRIYLITLAMELHPDWFEFLHAYLFKYMFYFMLFMLWVWWNEKLRYLPNKNSAPTLRFLT